MIERFIKNRIRGFKFLADLLTLLFALIGWLYFVQEYTGNVPRVAHYGITGLVFYSMGRKYVRDILPGIKKATEEDLKNVRKPAR